jgi:hypothetical protein
VGYWELDPDHPVGPATTRLWLGIWTSEDCRSSVALRGEPRVHEIDSAVLVTIPIRDRRARRRRGDEGHCRPGPAHRVVIELDEPLGDRRVFDGGRLPLRPAPSPTPTDRAAGASRPEPLELWSPVDLADIPFEYSCGGDPFRAQAIAEGQLSLDADPPIYGTAMFGGPITHLGTWRVVADDGERVTVATVVDDRPDAESALYSVDLVRTAQGWDWEGEGDCWPWARFQRGGRTTGLGGYWRLDRRRPAPTARSRVVHLKVWYLEGCRSAVRLRGRPRVAMTEEAVLIAVPVATTSGGDVCIGGSPTRVAVRLPEPLGERDLYDAGTLPIRRVNSKAGRADPAR